MNVRHRFIALAAGSLAVTVLLACASAMQVRSFQTTGNRLLQYRTYHWVADGTRATGDPRLDSNPFFERRLMQAAERELAARGYDRATSQSSDLILHYHANVTQRLDVGGIDPSHADCPDCGSQSLFDAGTIMLDFVDATSERVVWRAWAEGSIEGLIDNQQWLEDRIDQAVARIVGTLPRRPTAPVASDRVGLAED